MRLPLPESPAPLHVVTCDRSNRLPTPEAWNVGLKLLLAKSMVVSGKASTPPILPSLKAYRLQWLKVLKPATENVALPTRSRSTLVRLVRFGSIIADPPRRTSRTL